MNISASDSFVQIESSNPLNGAAIALAKYERLVFTFEQFLARQGVFKKPFGPSGLQRFQNSKPEDQQRYVDQLEKYLQVCLQAESDGVDVRYDAIGMLKYLCFRLRFQIPEDFMNTVTAEDIIEIFDYNGNQLFRNLHFFDISDYTIDDFFGNTWDYLYERSSVITKKIFERIALTEKELKCVPFDVPVHYMRERATENRKIVQVSLKYLAPLKKDGRACAWIASSRAAAVIEKSDPASDALVFL